MRRGRTTGRNLRATPAVAHVDGLFSRPYPLQGAAVELMVKKLQIKDALTAEEDYHDAVRTIAHTPYPAIEGMRNEQRLLKTPYPRIGDVNLEYLIDSRYIRKLDESGFFDRIYSK